MSIQLFLSFGILKRGQGHSYHSLIAQYFYRDCVTPRYPFKQKLKEADYIKQRPQRILRK